MAVASLGPYIPGHFDSVRPLLEFLPTREEAGSDFGSKHRKSTTCSEGKKGFKEPRITAASYNTYLPSVDPVFWRGFGRYAKVSTNNSVYLACRVNDVHDFCWLHFALKYDQCRQIYVKCHRNEGLLCQYSSSTAYNLICAYIMS